MGGGSGSQTDGPPERSAIPGFRRPLRQAGSCPVLSGPTAVGKTELVLQLAADFPIEVISLDSRQIYHGLRIGTAQPTASEQAACRHHLVDFLPPEETYSAQRFRDDFEELWRDITGRGRLPLLVGGAGLYLRAVSEGFFELPPESEKRLPSVRAEIAALSDAELATALRRVDPDSAARLHANDQYRRRRALEVYCLAGRPIGELTATQRRNPSLGLSFAVVRLARPAAITDRRIRDRTKSMLAAGWIAETRDLLEWHAPDCPGLRSLGYAEIVRFLQGRLAEDEVLESIVLATRQYAKRQRTWFAKVVSEASGAPEDPLLIEALRKAVQHGLDLLEER